MNDLFWEKEFTDWVTTTRANSLFVGHEQPFLPSSDLGYYDLSKTFTLNKQANIAKKYGLDGFGIYHYFFDEKTKALNIPIENLRKHTSIDIDYFICWVNADWDKEWVGDYKTILYKQKYSPVIYEKLAEDACIHFQDSRYVRIEGKPLFYIHNPKYLVLDEFKERFMQISIKYGFNEVLFAAPQIHISAGQECEIDYALGYPPGDYPLRNVKLESEAYRNIEGGVFSYPQYAEKYSSFILSKLNEHNYVPTILSGWDNTPRYKERGFVFKDFNTYDFSSLTHSILQSSIKKNKDFVMIKAWNEWAEGNVLEPSVKFDYEILESVKQVKREVGF